MKYLSMVICTLLVFSACAAKEKKITITQLTPISPINKYILDSVIGKHDPAIVETNYDKTQIYSIWADGLKSKTIVSFMGEKIVHTFNNGVVLVMKPDLDRGVVECQFNNGEAFIIKKE